MMSILICLKAGTLSLNDQEFLIFFCNSLVQQANDNLFGSATFRYNKMIPTLGGRRENWQKVFGSLNFFSFLFPFFCLFFLLSFFIILITRLYILKFGNLYRYASLEKILWTIIVFKSFRNIFRKLGKKFWSFVDDIDKDKALFVSCCWVWSQNVVMQQRKQKLLTFTRLKC